MNNLEEKQQNFKKALDIYIKNEHSRYNIGTYKEKTLHMVLKNFLEPNTQYHEVKYKKFICDIKKDNEIIEIQTSGFNRLRKKLDAFLTENIVTVVYPIPKRKYLCWINEQTAEITKERKSPKVGSVYDIVYELYKILSYLENDKLNIKIIFLEITEYKILNGWDEKGKRGSSRYERIPKEYLSECNFSCKNDYRQFIPANLPQQFTVKEFATLAKVNRKTAYLTIRVLEKKGIAEFLKKNGREFVYIILYK